jgi:hypothetical protein
MKFINNTQHRYNLQPKSVGTVLYVLPSGNVHEMPHWAVLPLINYSFTLSKANQRHVAHETHIFKGNEAFASSRVG